MRLWFASAENRYAQRGWFAMLDIFRAGSAVLTFPAPFRMRVLRLRLIGAAEMQMVPAIARIIDTDAIDYRELALDSVTCGHREQLVVPGPSALPLLAVCEIPNTPDVGLVLDICDAGEMFTVRLSTGAEKIEGKMVGLVADWKRQG